MQRGLVFNLQKYSVRDGPGIRTTVFLKGCPLRCWWCHNPEGMALQRELIFFDGRCVACGQCREVCPRASNEAGTGPLAPRREDCLLCAACVAACPTEAREMAGREMSVDEVIDFVMRDRIFYEESGGGVTFSGGEPLQQPAFLRELLEACRARALHTAVDTCGCAPVETVLEIAKLTDLFLYDLKFVDETKHRLYTGVSNVLLLDNLRTLAQRGARLWIRIPFIPGVNDSAEDLEALARWLVALPQVERVNLLPYHKSGLAKFARLGRPCALTEVVPPAAAQIERAVSILRGCGLPAE